MVTIGALFVVLAFSGLEALGQLATLPSGSKETSWTSGQRKSIDYLMGVPGFDKLKQGDYKLVISEYLDPDPESGFAVPRFEFELKINKDFRFYDLHGKRGTVVTGLGGGWGGPQVHFSGGPAKWRGIDIWVGTFDIDTGLPRSISLVSELRVNDLTLPKSTKVYFRRHRERLIAGFPPIVCIQAEKELTIAGLTIPAGKVVNFDEKGAPLLEFTSTACAHTPPDIVDPPATEAPCLNCDGAGEGAAKGSSN